MPARKPSWTTVFPPPVVAFPLSFLTLWRCIGVEELVKSQTAKSVKFSRRSSTSVGTPASGLKCRGTSEKNFAHRGQQKRYAGSIIVPRTVTTKPESVFYHSAVAAWSLRPYSFYPRRTAANVWPIVPSVGFIPFVFFHLSWHGVLCSCWISSTASWPHRAAYARRCSSNGWHSGCQSLKFCRSKSDFPLPTGCACDARSAGRGHGANTNFSLQLKTEKWRDIKFNLQYQRPEPESKECVLLCGNEIKEINCQVNLDVTNRTVTLEPFGNGEFVFNNGKVL